MSHNQETELKFLLDGDKLATLPEIGQDLAKANPSDSQFQELLKTQQQWNDRRSELEKEFHDDQSSTAYNDKLKALDDARDQEYRRVLGDSVFDTLQKEQDPGYSRMKKYVNTWGLDDNKIDSVYHTVKYYEKNAEDYQARARALEVQGQSVDWDAVNRNLLQFADQTRQALQKLSPGGSQPRLAFPFPAPPKEHTSVATGQPERLRLTAAPAGAAAARANSMLRARLRM